MLRLHRPDFREPPAAHPTHPAIVGTRLPGNDLLLQALWIDLKAPTAEEIAAVERALGLQLPSEAAIAEIEASSRVYQRGDARVMNILLPVGIDRDQPDATDISLILTKNQLVTIRYADAQAFRMLEQNLGDRQTPDAAAGAPGLLLRLLDNIVDRSADLLEKMGDEIDRISARIFGLDAEAPSKFPTNELKEILRAIGRIQFILNKLYESLVTQMRATSFLSTEKTGAFADPALSTQLQSLERDIKSLTENGSYLIENMNFLLDAAVGRISIEQNAIVKIFTIAAVVFLPPTLIASIYGMNFHDIPEYDLPYAYPVVLGVMVLTALVPLYWFKRKGWF